MRERQRDESPLIRFRAGHQQAQFFTELTSVF
jgi:hypothetical protein